MSEFIRRIVDLAGSGIGILVLSPIFAAISLAIVATSKGPAIYRGTRAGKNGKPFRIIKFRTMVVDAENKGGTTTGLHDARVTTIGHVLRAKKLDELPQLFNVLLGQMTLVGPRPEVFEYAGKYTQDERRILSVKPGITDLASLEFFRLDKLVGTEDPDTAYRKIVLPRKIRLRLEYVDRRSLALDASILARTFLTVGRGLVGRSNA